jgi:hypothetical protein
MPGHEGPGKLGLTQWEMYLRHGVGATKILI